MVKEIKEIKIENNNGTIKVLFEKQLTDEQTYKYICESNFFLDECVEIDKFSGQELVDYVNTLDLQWILIEVIEPV